MSIDDPGWDSPSFDDAGDGWSEPQSPTPEPKPGGGGSGLPPWKQPRLLGIGGGILAAIIIIVLVVVLAGRGGNSTNTGQTLPPPTVSSAATSPVTPATGVPSTASTSANNSSPGEESLAAYDKAADRVCRRYKPILKEDSRAQDLAGVAEEEGKELAALQDLNSPTDDSDGAEQWLNEVTEAVDDLDADNMSGYDQVALQADEDADQLGMHVCNYGH